MTKDDIIRMAREAGFVEYELEDYTPSGHDIRYERFAAFVAAAEREKCIDIVAFHGGSIEIEAAIRARGQA